MLVILFVLISPRFKHTLHSRLDGKSVIELLLLLKSLGMHSITPLELKNLVALLKDQFPYKSHVIHVLSSMSKGKETNFHIFLLKMVLHEKVFVINEYCCNL